MSTDVRRAPLPVAQQVFSESPPPATTVGRLLADIHELAPAIAARAAEIENARRLPSDLVATLKSIGVFRLFVASSHGGLELDLPTGLEILATLSRIDGSVGWIAMNNSVGSLFVPSLPRETYERIYRDGPNVTFAGVSQPAGKAWPAAGGWRVGGRWPFASGCRHADWMAGFCVVTEEDGKPLLGEAGQSQMRCVWLPARDWRIEDTWHAAGLKGTGSDHIVLEDKVVPAANFFDPLRGTPCLPGPLYRAVPQLLPLLNGAAALGMAEGALDDLLAVADAGRQQLRAAVPMRESETFHYELGRVVADLVAARAFLQAQGASHWRHAVAGTLNDEALLAEGTQAGIWVTTTCLRVVDACFALAGGSAVYDSSSLQRRLRDLHVAAQHATVQQRHYAAAGKSVGERFRRRPTELDQAAVEVVVPRRGAANIAH
jgi:alkylation response protein AidB-like acyl-CoA dehydrogenase